MIVVSHVVRAVKSTRLDVHSFDAAFSVVDQEIAKIVAAIAALRPKNTTPPKRPHRGPTTPRKAA